MRASHDIWSFRGNNTPTNTYPGVNTKNAPAAIIRRRENCVSSPMTITKTTAAQTKITRMSPQYGTRLSRAGIHNPSRRGRASAFRSLNTNIKTVSYWGYRSCSLQGRPVAPTSPPHAGEVDPEPLVETNRVSRPVDPYQQPTQNVPPTNWPATTPWPTLPGRTSWRVPAAHHCREPASCGPGSPRGVRDCPAPKDHAIRAVVEQAADTCLPARETC